MPDPNNQGSNRQINEIEPNIPREERKTTPKVFLENMLISISVVMSPNRALLLFF